GQYALQNVYVTNLAGFTGCFASPTNIGNLAVGQFALIDCNNTCTSVSSNFYEVAVRGEASQATTEVCAYNAQGQLIVTSSQCETCVQCQGKANLLVYKQVVCDTNGPLGIAGCDAFSSNLNSQKTATGIRTDVPLNCP